MNWTMFMVNANAMSFLLMTYKQNLVHSSFFKFLFIEINKLVKLLESYKIFFLDTYRIRIAYYSLIHEFIDMGNQYTLFFFMKLQFNSICLTLIHLKRHNVLFTYLNFRMPHYLQVGKSSQQN